MINNSAELIPYSAQLNCHKEIILLVDISASMTDTMKSVKSSLLAFRDALLEKTPKEINSIPAIERDALLRERINLRLITFSRKAKEVWSNETEETFENVVINLETEIMTNMGDAIKLAFSKVNPEKYTWIIVMTDGNSNEGPCRTAGAFQRLVTSKPLNTKVVTLGYGSDFDPEVLNKVGSFVYIDNSEVIPVVLGNLAGEILTTVGFNCVIDNSDINVSEITDDTLITSEKEQGKILVGNRVIPALSAGTVYNYIYLSNKKVDLIIRYTNLVTNEIVEIKPIVKKSNQPPGDELRELFFKAETERLVYDLYRAIQSNRTPQIVIKIRKVLEEWKDEIAEPYKDQVIQLIENSSKVRGTRMASSALNYALGTGYSNPDLHGYAASASNATHYYMASPMLNDN
jgi:uncharacterized protein YegL